MMLTVADGYGAGPGIMGEMMARDLVGRPGCERFPNDGLARISVGLQMHGFKTVMAGTWQMGEEPAKIPSAPAVIRVAGLLADTDEFDAQPDRR